MPRQTLRDKISKRTLGPTDQADIYQSVTRSNTVNFTVDGEETPCRAINAESDGLANLVQDDDVVVSYFLHKGYNPVVAKRINTGGAGQNLWALF